MPESTETPLPTDTPSPMIGGDTDRRRHVSPLTKGPRGERRPPEHHPHNPARTTSVRRFATGSARFFINHPTPHVTLRTAVGTAIFVLASLAQATCTPANVPARTEWTEPVTHMDFVLIGAGSFTMGTPLSEHLREEQEAEHRVVLSRPFYLGRYEVTQGQWMAVMDSNPSQFSDCGADCAVETVNLPAIETFVDRVEEAGGETLRLPTEAEWEYACRAGSTHAFAFGSTLLPTQASFDPSDPYAGAPPGPAPKTPVEVGSFAPNAWGIHDMHGGMWEWTSDEHCPYSGDEEDPRLHCNSGFQVIRGGSWLYGADSARCGLRYTHRPRDDGPSLGFRLVRDVPQK